MSSCNALSACNSNNLPQTGPEPLVLDNSQTITSGSKTSCSRPKHTSWPGSLLTTLLAKLKNRNTGNIDSSLPEQILGTLDSLGIVLLDTNAKCIYVSHGWRNMAAASDTDLSPAKWLNTIHRDDRHQVQAGFSDAISHRKQYYEECRLQSGSQQQRWVSWRAQPVFADNGQFSGCLGTFTDVTESRNTSASLLQLSLYDPLTKLPNRTLLTRRLQHALNESPDQDNKLALIFIDLDGFKLVNDTLGYHPGDHLIMEISQRIGNCLDAGDTLARLGSDEFTAIIRCSNSTARAECAVDRIMAEIKKPIVINDETVFVTASVGIALSKAGINADGLIRRADIAMYDAKKASGGTAKYYSHRLTADNRARLTVGSLLHMALARKEFKVHYQPQQDIRTNRIIGSEALLRWHNPEVGTISPTVFVPLLEDRGLINQVGEWVLSQSCHMQAQWHREFPQTLTTVSVNVSSIQLHDRTFLQKLKTILNESSLRPEYLVLEITESILLDEYVGDSNLLHKIEALGVKLALDDFGTGYGSFSYLKKHPIDHIKIDRSFVDNLFACEENKAITTSIIDLSHKLGKTVIAEGVDNQEELDFLMMHGCDIYQGFFSSRAIPSADFAKRFLIPHHRRGTSIA